MLYLVDSSIYIFRAWQTLPPTLTNTFGEQANAVTGFADTIAQIIQQEQPAYMVCAFDHSYGTGERYSIYPEYKANRPPAPPELKIQFKRCLEVAQAMGITCIGSKQVEADDIIGQCAEVARNREVPVTIVSADKDLAQFISKNDIYWNLARKQRFTAKQLQQRYKVRTDQIADMLALCGDKVDNIPGVPGVGQTTAAKLLAKWQTLPELFDNMGKVADMGFRGAPRVAMLLYEHKQDVLLARKLTGLIRDKSIPDSLDAFTLVRPDRQSVIEKLLAAGFTESRSARLASAISADTAHT